MHRKLIRFFRTKARVAGKSPGFTPLEIPRGIRIQGKKRRFLTGFTLTEVVIASALLIIAMVPILKALTSAHLTRSIIERKTRSLTLARAKLDEIRARSIYNYSSTFMKTSTPLDGPYLCNVKDTSKGTDLREIVISVGYDLNGNNVLETDEVEVTLTTLVARRW